MKKQAPRRSPALKTVAPEPVPQTREQFSDLEGASITEMAAELEEIKELVEGNNSTIKRIQAELQACCAHNLDLRERHAKLLQKLQVEAILPDPVK